MNEVPNSSNMIVPGSIGFCGLAVFRVFAHSWRKQSTGYVTSCRDTETHSGHEREKTELDDWIWFCCHRDENSTVKPSHAVASELSL